MAINLRPSLETARPPTVNIPTVTSASTFVLFMIDLDVPRNNTRLTLLHWFVPSATLSGQTNNTLLVPATNSSGASYLQPSPPVGDIPHRYVFLVFARPDNFTVPSQFAAINPPSSTQARIGFNISEFVAAAGLGQPLAANYIRVQNTTATSTATGSSAGTGTGAGASQTSVEAVQRNNALAKRGLEWGMVATAVTGFLGVWVLDL